MQNERKGKEVYVMGHHSGHIPHHATNVVRPNIFSLEDNDMGLFFDIIIPC